MQVDLVDRTNRPTNWAAAAWKPVRDGWICANFGVARLVRNTATHCTGPLDLVTNPPRHNGSIFFESALDGMIAINMIHIAPWEATRGLMLGAGELLKPGGFLYLYGPYKIDGAHAAPSNATFDDSLRARNRNWGVRDKDDVSRIAAQRDLRLAELIAMPVNNFSLIFRKA